MPDLERSALPPLPRAILELYAGALREVRFPDLDHETLQASVDALHEATQEVERVEAALSEARRIAAARADTLTAQAQRALSYAQVFAAGHPELGTLLAPIEQLAKSFATPQADLGKRRGRPKKSKTPELFHDEDGGEAREAELNDHAAA